jgi:hypothetical protein
VLLACLCYIQRDLDKTLRPYAKGSAALACRGTQEGVALLQETLAILAHLHEAWLQASNTTVDQQSSAGRSTFDDVQRTRMECHRSKIGCELLGVFGLLPIDHEAASTGQEGNSQLTLPLHLRCCH